MTNHPISIESAGGEYMESVLVVGWSAKPGDRVKAGDVIVTVETAKAATEVEASHDGWLARIDFAEGQEAPVGAVLGLISDSEPTAEDAELGAAAETATDQTAEATAKEDTHPEAISRPAGARVIASPLARRLAQQADLDLSGIDGSGPNGRIKQRDILKALESRKASAIASPPAPAYLPAPSVTARAQTVPVVFLHGFGADKSAWRQTIPLLGSNVETLALDLPGHGSSADQSVPSMDQLAFWLSDRLEAMGIERAHFVGHSLGGAATLALSALGRLTMQSVTLLAPGGLGPEINGGFINGLTQSTTPEALDRWLTTMIGEKSDLPQGYASSVLRQMDRIGNRPALEALAGRLFAQGTQAFDMLPALKALCVPTRIVWGRSDRIIPTSHAAQAPDFAAVHLLPGIGHVPQMEAAALTARLIMETVRSAH